MTWLILQFVIAVLLLTKAAAWFSRAAALVANLTGMPRVVLGATLIGLITNLPELAVTSLAAWRQHGEIALGNPVGSNICNTGLILGLCLIRAKGVIETAWLRDHGLPMLLASTLLYGIATWMNITTPVALLLLALCAAYIAWSVASARRAPALARQAEAFAEDTLGAKAGIRQQWSVAGLLLVLSVPLVIVSSRWVLGVAVELAQVLALPEGVIALTLVAIGTSLPELATALAALRHGHQDTSIGIVLGSNIYNILGVLGVGGLITQLPVTLANRLYDLPMMMLVLAIPLVPCLFGRTPGRVTGVILISLYGVYTYSLFTLYGVFT